MAGRWQNLYDLKIRFQFEEIRLMIIKGYRDYEIARKIGLTPRALRELRKKYPEFDDVFKGAKKLLATKINEAMIKSALGYEYDEKYYEETTDSKGKKTKKQKITTKHVTPNPVSGIFLLCNYDGDNFKRTDMPKVEAREKVEIIDDLNGVGFNEDTTK